ERVGRLAGRSALRAIEPGEADIPPPELLEICQIPLIVIGVLEAMLLDELAHLRVADARGVQPDHVLEAHGPDRADGREPQRARDGALGAELPEERVLRDLGLPLGDVFLNRAQGASTNMDVNAPRMSPRDPPQGVADARSAQRYLSDAAHERSMPVGRA